MINFRAITASGERIHSALSAFNFPAGEVHIKVKENRELEATEIAVLQLTAGSMHDDLFMLGAWHQYLSFDEQGLEREDKPKMILILPYVPGARADKGTPYTAGLYGWFIRSLNLDQVIIFDPHSPVIIRELGNNVTVVYSEEILGSTGTYNGVIAPDKGALDRTRRIADSLGLPLYPVTKHRDQETGKLSGFDASSIPDHGHFLITDDICDGGGTFLGMIDAYNGSATFDLYVSHGVFSGQALEKLPTRFEKIYTTNSYNPSRDLNVANDRRAFHKRAIIAKLLDHVN